MPSPIYIAGATGAGKSEIAVALAKRVDGEIVNADAYQVYRGFDIVAAIPTEQERAGIPHHLFSCIDPTESFDASRYVGLAEPVIEAVRSRGRHPIVVGGSGLYLKALTHGLAPTPKGEPALREALEHSPLEDLCQWLKQLDPQGAAETNLKNRRYVTRNLEIALLAGRPASEIKREWQRNQPDIDAFHLTRDRDRLNDRINRRTESMFAAGLVEEIRQLGDLSITAERAIGVREIRALLAGEIDQAEAIAAIQQATRRFAKRQRTWFRRENALQSICLDDYASPQSVAAFIAASLST